MNASTKSAHIAASSTQTEAYEATNGKITTQHATVRDAIDAAERMCDETQTPTSVCVGAKTLHVFNYEGRVVQYR